MSWVSLPREMRKDILLYVFVPGKARKDAAMIMVPHLKNRVCWSVGCGDNVVPCGSDTLTLLRNMVLVNKEFAEDAREAFFKQTIFDLVQYDAPHPDPGLFVNSMTENGPFFNSRTIDILRGLEAYGHIQNIRLQLRSYLRTNDDSSTWQNLESFKAHSFPKHMLSDLTLVPTMGIDRTGIINGNYCWSKHYINTVIGFVRLNVVKTTLTVFASSRSEASICAVHIKEKGEVVVAGYLRKYVDDIVRALLHSHAWPTGMVFKLVHAWPKGHPARYATVGEDLEVTYRD